MIKNFVITGLTDDFIDVEIHSPLGVKHIRADKGLSALNANWSGAIIHPMHVQTGKETFVIYKTATFPSQVLYSRSGLFHNATVLNNQAVLIPVKYTTQGRYYLTVTDGVFEEELTIDVGNVAVVVGAFNIANVISNTLNIIGKQKVLFEGSGFNGVDRVADPDSVSNSFTVVDDENLVVELEAQAATGLRTFEFFDAGNNSLGTYDLTFEDNNEQRGESFFWQRDDNVSIWIPELSSNEAIVAGTNMPFSSTPCLFEVKNKLDNKIIKIVRDFHGEVIPNAIYNINRMDGTFIFTGNANSKGVIYLDPTTLPSQFILRIDRIDLPVTEYFINAGGK